jgi:hypothetical protein
MNDCYKFSDFNMFSGKIATSSGCFCREALALKVGANVVPNLKLPCSVHLLPGQTAVTDELPLRCLDNP